MAQHIVNCPPLIEPVLIRELQMARSLSGETLAVIEQCRYDQKRLCALWLSLRRRSKDVPPLQHFLTHDEGEAALYERHRAAVRDAPFLAEAFKLRTFMDLAIEFFQSEPPR